MIEHADDYFEGKGKKQDQFIRSGPQEPGGHWLGGRLNLIRVLEEVKAIQDEIDKIALPPVSREEMKGAKHKK
jgi:hypothetical protein